MTPDTSIIIPTYNREHMLRELLQSLAQQDWPGATGVAGRFEVIVVDDGSTDDTRSIVTDSYPFTLRYINQQNQGDAAARNTGARASQAEFLVFLDDDILVAPDYLRRLLEGHAGQQKTIISGAEILWLDDAMPTLNLKFDILDFELQPMPFVELCSNNMSLRRQDYDDIGPMVNLDFAGSSMWCDVEFAYRAYRRGYTFQRSTRAICWHRDYVQRDLESHKRRMYEAAYRAATLFQKHPDLRSFLPMFADMTPINRANDPPPLIARKLMRRLSSTPLVLPLLEGLASRLQSRFPTTRFERWIIGAHIWRGYRCGISEDHRR